MSDDIDIPQEWREEKLAELRYLRACIYRWAGGKMPGTEAMQHFRKLAAEMRDQQAAYQKWRVGPRKGSESFHYKWGACLADE